MAKTQEKTDNRIGRFVYTGMQKHKGYVGYDFDRNIKKKLESLLPSDSIAIIKHKSIGIYQIRDTAVVVELIGLRFSDKDTSLQVYNEDDAKISETLKKLEEAFA